MALAPGTRIGPYEIVAPLGAGGMGEVYRARDARLGREVAVKTLPAALSGDPGRLRRFEQEAKSTGLLNHPNILAVFDVGTHEGAPYVVSELLEGQTLRDRIAGGPLPPRKAIDYGAQVARGLAAAHDKGVVHRDLKPENLFVTGDGRVKILDFGLAKLLDTAAGPESVTREIAPATDAGTVLGTVGYMSPEQVRATPVDHRSDIFSFGAVLYEMLSGQRAFRGGSAIETMNAILKEDPPPLTETSRQLPPSLERIVAHCLEKNPQERFQSAHDVAFDLEQLSGSSTSGPALPVVAAGRSRAWGVAALALLALAAAFAAGRTTVPAAPLVTFRPVTFQHGWAKDARFSPDGNQVYYHAWWPGVEPDIYVTEPGKPESRALGLKAVGLGGISRSGELLIGRAGSGAVAQVPAGGGAPRDVIADAFEAEWGPDGTTMAIVRNGPQGQQLEYPVGRALCSAPGIRFPRVSASGDLVAFSEHPLAGDYRGDVAVVDREGKKRTLSRNWADIRGVTWSPDGREVWFTATRSGAESSLWAVDLQGVERHVFHAPGSLAIQDTRPDGRVLLAVQRRRPAIYGRMPGDTADRTLSWLDYSIATALSPDGRSLLFAEQGEGGGADYATYLRGMDGSLPVRLGKGAAADLSPDGRFALVIDMAVPMQLVLLPTGAGAPRALPRGNLAQIHGASFLPGGTSVVMSANPEGRATRLYRQDLAGGDPQPISQEGVAAQWRSIPVMPDGSGVIGTNPAGQLTIYPIDGGAPRPVPGALPYEDALAVTPDSRFAFVLPSRATGAVFKLDLRTGQRQPWKVIRRETGNPAAFLNNLVMSPDGETWAYTFRDDTSTLYVAEGLR